MFRSLCRFVSILLMLCLLLAGVPVQSAHAATGPRCYVDSTPSGAGNTGESWGDAYTNLLAALYDANCTEVWVAAGVYKPGALRTLAFIVESGETVYGGFAGTETALSERVPGANLTVLSGDIDNNDAVDGDGITVEAADIVGDNSYHVVLMSPATEDMTSATILDGFTITAGNADPNVTSIRDGGGVLCIHIYECSPTLSNLRIIGNAANRGGGLYSAGWQTGFASSPMLSNVTFSGNYASFNGGGMYNDGNNGGLSSPTLSNVTFNNNHADSYGGAMYNDGGNDFPAVIYGTSAPHLNNVTISGNSATLGAGGIYNWQEPGFAATNLTNVILWGNSAPSDPEMNNSGVDPIVDHSLIQDSMPGGVWDPAFGTDGGGNRDADPRLGPLQDNGGPTPTMALLPGSLAINAGDDASCASAPVSGLDQRGIARPQGPHCDIGAFEAEITWESAADFNDDGTTEVSLYRSGMWFVKDVFDVPYGGVPGDVPVPGDYDDDGDVEIAIYRSGTWYIKDVADHAFGGVPGDVPVPGDYDGDGDTDVAVFRSGVWYIKDQPTVAYGAPGDIPVQADYDGNGTTDIAVYRSGMWYVKDGTSFAYGGAPSDFPVPADYDADGDADGAVFRDGMWYLRDLTSHAYGAPGDLPVPGDYDGNGSADIAVYRLGMWYIKDQTSVPYGGVPGDFPLPASDTDGDGDPYQ